MQSTSFRVFLTLCVLYALAALLPDDLARRSLDITAVTPKASVQERPTEYTMGTVDPAWQE